MHIVKHLALSRFAILLALPSSPCGAQMILFEENFDSDATANWIFNSSQFDAADDEFNQEANFFFDYSTVGIPPAPGGTLSTTRGLKMEVNIPDGTGTFAGASASPVDSEFTGDYLLTFYSWHNFPTSGVGSTQMVGGGIGALTDRAQFPGTRIDGVYFVASSDGGTALDYRAYINTGAPLAETSGVYAAGSAAGATNNTNPYYDQFGRKSVPSAQATLFPQQDPAYVSPAGSQGYDWHKVEILKLENTVTWSIDGKLIATVDATDQLNGANIFLGMFDINAGTTDEAGRPVNFALFDNITVTQVPEPSAVGLGLLACGALVARRRRSN